jgi:hypothetical protein
MNFSRKTLSLAALALTPALFAFALRGDSLSFKPEAGSEVEKSCSMTGSLFIDDVMITADGEQLPAEMFGEMLDQAMELEVLMGVTDQYVKSGDGKPMVLLRTFNELSGNMSVGGEEGDTEEPEMVGSTVKFAWNSDDEQYDLSYEDGDGDEDELEGLNVDMDFLCLLPDDEVDVGDSWEVPGESVATLFFPGGFPMGGAGGDEGGEMMDMAGDAMGSQMEEALEDFVVECTYKGDDEDGGAVIAFEYKGELSLDLSDLAMEALEMQDMGEVEMDADITLSMDFELEGEGLMTWDMKAGHVKGFEMNAEVIMLMDASADIEAMGESHTGEASVEVSGEMAWEMSVE